LKCEKREVAVSLSKQIKRRAHSMPTHFCRSIAAGPDEVSCIPTGFVTLYLFANATSPDSWTFCYI